MPQTPEQRSYMDDPSTSGVEGFGLLDYNARMYDPAIGRFVSADSIVPGGMQGLDRYAYVGNNPVRFNDPSGHCYDDPDAPAEERCGEQKESSGYKANWLQTTLREKYGWDVASDFTEQELQEIYNAALAIETYVNSLSNGMGLEWMLAYLGNTEFVHTDGDYNMALPGWAPGMNGTNTVLLISGHFNIGTVIHEMGHVWDMNSSKKTTHLGTIGGVADNLNGFIGGSISGCSPLAGVACNRWVNTYEIFPSPFIPETSVIHGVEYDVRFPGDDHYGNGSTADYLAESFKNNVLGLGGVPQPASVFVNNAIMAQAQ